MAKICILTGGPCTGKTTIINELKERGYIIFEENTHQIPLDKSGEEFENILFKIRKDQLKSAKDHEGFIFADRSLIDNIAYSKVHKNQIKEDFNEDIKDIKFHKVFILDPLDFYEYTKNRKTPEELQKKIHDTINDTYKSLGHNPIRIPNMTVEKRIDFILNNLN